MALVRDYTDSELVNLLSDKAEILFARLLTKADGCGNYFADPILIKSSCFPRKDYRSSQISTWLKELSEQHTLGTSTQPTALIRLYESSGRQYLHIFKYGQTLKYKSAKYPPPEFLNSDPPEEKRSDIEVEVKLAMPFSGERFLGVWDLLMKEKKWRGKSFAARQMSLKKLSEHPEVDAIQMMENTIAGNWQGLFELKKSQNGNSTNRKKGFNVASVKSVLANLAELKRADSDRLLQAPIDPDIKTGTTG